MGAAAGGAVAVAEMRELTLGLLKRKALTLYWNPAGALRKYLRKALMLPLELRENYYAHWNYVSFRGKRVLDVGADYGSTVDFFLKLGAREVIAVEGEWRNARLLFRRYGRDPRVTCIRMWVSSPDVFSWLIRRFKPDVVKVDIEGGEKHLLRVPRPILRQAPAYLIEAHSDELHRALVTLFEQLGYKVETRYERGQAKVIVATLHA
jgi:hypothetical protein